MRSISSCVIILFVVLLNLHASGDKGLVANFDFGNKSCEDGYYKVQGNSVFNYARGFGFDFNSSATNKEANQKGVLSDYCTSDKPFFFSSLVPEGNYKVTVVVGNNDVACNLTIKAESRRLMVHNLKTEKGEFKEITFNVNMRMPMLPSGRSVGLKKAELNGHLSWDNKLTLEFNGDNPSVAAITIERTGDVKTVYICGDSTVTDQRNEPWSGWGMILPLFFDENICVANYAESGLTLKAFKGQRRLAKILTLIQPGDYMFVQFGHNDMKSGAKTPANTVYREMLLEYANAAREKGAIPVLVTSMHRRAFDSEGQIINTLEDYPAAVIQTGKENNIPVIDLHAMSEKLYEALGSEGSKKLLVHYPAGTFPGQDKALADNTHHNGYGAYELAKCVVEGLKQTQLDLVRFLKKDLKEYDPSKPDKFSTNFIPLSPFYNIEKPDGN